MNDFQKWSVLAFRAMDDAGRVLMTIEPESTTEGERLDQLKATIRELLTQCVLLNGLCTRRQLDERFGFGKLDTDALNVQLGLKQQAEPVGEVIDERGEVDYISYVPPVGTALYTAQPQRKPLTDEEIEQAQRDVWRSLPSDFDYTTSSWIEIGIRYAEAAHGIKENT